MGKKIAIGGSITATTQAESAIDAIPKESCEPPGSAQPLKRGHSPSLNPEKAVEEHLREEVCADDGDPEDDGEKAEHDRQAPKRGGDDAVNALIEVPFCPGAPANGAIRQRLGLCIDPFYHLVSEAGLEGAAERIGSGKNFFGQHLVRIR